MNVRWIVAPFIAIFLVIAVNPGAAGACGGFFCTTIPVDQAAERVIFTMDDGTVTTYVQINYVGRPEDFAWVLPVPAVPKVDTAEMAMFRDLDRLTAPQWLPPRPPDCLRVPQPAAAPASAARSDGATTVLASGEVGPFGYHVVQSSDPDDLVRWLRDNGYRITDEMIPLVKMYTDEGLIFLAMRLKPGQNTSDLVPVKLTYDSSLPMIPLRLTAVAATPDMPVIVWVFARNQVASLNFTSISIADSEVKFRPFGGQNDYLQVVSQAVDQAGGRAFVTELAQPTTALRPPSDPAVSLLFQQYPYLTRLYTRISPDEMTIDPVFDLAPGLPNVSNIHDLRDKPSPWTCDDNFSTWRSVGSAGPPPPAMAAGRYLQRLGVGGAPKGWLMFSIVAVTALVLFRKRGTVASGSATVFGRVRDHISGLRLTPDAVAILFLEMIFLQGFHEMEHIVQVFQRTVLGIGNGAGMLGSVFDVEPVHMVYNLAFLLLLGAVYVGCRRDVSAIPARPVAVMRLLGVAFVFQTWHTVEHLAKMLQYFETGLNGTPGIVGYWIPIVYLHLGYNTALYLPVVIAFFIGGFHLAAGRVLAESFGRKRRRRTRPRLAS